MIGLWNASCKNKKYGGTLALYVLYSLRQKPKSGYDIIGEIMEKSEGKWAPSKGTLYPILGHLKEQKLVEIYTTGKRGKNIFRLTSAGKTALSEVGKQRKEWRENFRRFRNLFIDILGEGHADVSGLLFEIRDAAVGLSENGKKEEATILLKKCLAGLKSIKAKVPGKLQEVN